MNSKMNNNELLQTIGSCLLAAVVYIFVLLQFITAAVDGKIETREGLVEGISAHLIGILGLLVMLGGTYLLATYVFFRTFPPFTEFGLFLLALLTVVIVIASILCKSESQRNERPQVDRASCPNCHQFLGGEKTGDKLIGMFQKNETLTAMGGIARRNQVARYEKYEAHYKCIRCNYEWKTYRTMRQ